jgi:hypothetical protein
MTGAQAQQPLYNKLPIQPIPPPPTAIGDPWIDFSWISPTTDIPSSRQNFNNRAAAAIIGAEQNRAIVGADGGYFGVGILARWAYLDYFDDPPTGASDRQAVTAQLAHAQPGLAGTTEGTPAQKEYDFLMHYYIPLVYRYYDDLADPTFGGSTALRDHLVNDLLGGATRSGTPSGRRVAGRADAHEFDYLHETASGPFGIGTIDIFDVPETENHLLGINAARYLVNQLLFQRSYDPQYDNNRNGDSNQSIEPTTQFILEFLGTVPGHSGSLNNDFLEYNARPYQSEAIWPLLNLATYAYDSRVKMAARMVLDYISAKVAVSSCNLRRIAPFRRRNETEYYGPLDSNGYLQSPLLQSTNIGGSNFEPDPQLSIFAQLAGNLEMLGAGIPGATNRAPEVDYDENMVHAGISDYRVPDPILDLFVNPKHRQFYQSFHHDAGNGIYADELYYGSPSYWISAGGHPTDYAYTLSVNAPVAAIIPILTDLLNPAWALGSGVATVVTLLAADPNARGESSDLGAATPTVFMPANQGDNLGQMIQFGKYTAGGDASQHSHMGVAPDFACGSDMAPLPPGLQIERVGGWIFVNEGHDGEQTSGFYLAIYNGSASGNPVNLLEAYDTWLHPGLSYEAFKNNIVAQHGLIPTFSPGAQNLYTTQSGYTIQFTVDPDKDNASAELLQGTGFIIQPDRQKFVSGTILNSDESNGAVQRIEIANPAFGPGSIIFDFTDPHGPVRTSESGQIEHTGVPNELWVNPNAPAALAQEGDFGAPFKTLGGAAAAVVPGGTVNIVPGSWSESVTITKAMTLRSYPGAAVVGSP